MFELGTSLHDNTSIFLFYRMKKTIQTSGMHCKSCEMLIKQSIKDLWKSVKVLSLSHKTGKLEVEISDEADEEKVYRAIQGAGFSIWEKTKGVAVSRLSQIWWLFLAGILLVFFLKINISSLIPEYETLTWPIAILIGMVASVSSCLALTWGLIIGYTESVETKNNFLTQLQFHLWRFLMFIIGWAFLGAVWGSVGQNIWIPIILNSLVGLVLFYLWLQILGIVPNISRFGFHLPSWMSEQWLAIKNPIFAPVVGAFTFLLPCWFTQSMQLFALQSGSPLVWATIMGAFAIGTLPVLLSLWIGTKYIKDTLSFFNPFIASILIVFGLLTLGNGYTLAKIASFSGEIHKSGENLPQETVEVSSNGSTFTPNPIRLSVWKNYTLRITPTHDGIWCLYALAYNGKNYLIKKWETFEIQVDGSQKTEIPLVCAAMWMGMGSIIIE